MKTFTVAFLPGGIFGGTRSPALRYLPSHLILNISIPIVPQSFDRAERHGTLPLLSRIVPLIGRFHGQITFIVFLADPTGGTAPSPGERGQPPVRCHFAVGRRAFGD